MKLRFGVGCTEARKNGDIEALADAMRALKNADILGTTFCFNKDVRLYIRNNTGLIRKVDHIGVQLAVVPSSIGVQECLGPKSQSCMYCFTTLYYTTYFSLFSDPF